MWTRAKVDELLASYQADAARAEHLRLEIADLKLAVSKLMATLDVDMIGPGAQVITGMPHGNAVSSPTEKLAIKLASGWIPTDIAEMREEIRTRELELADIEVISYYVQAWMSALSEREEWLIRKQVIQHEFWRDVLDDYARIYQVRLSQDSLGRMKKRALEKIYQTAGAVE